MIDFLLNNILQAGNYVRDDVVGNLIQLISENDEHHAYAAQQLWTMLNGDLDSKQPLCQVACWTLGEYADLVTTSLNGGQPFDQDAVVDMCEKIISSNLMTIATKEYAFSAVVKLSVRFPALAPKVKTITDTYGSHMNTELQQRSTEFSNLFTKFDNLRASVLDRMPPMKAPERSNGQANGSEENGLLDDSDLLGQVSNMSMNDIMDNSFDSPEKMFGSSSPTPATSAAGTTFVPMTKSSVDKYDALLDLIGIDTGSNTTMSNSNDFMATNSSLSSLASLANINPLPAASSNGIVGVSSNQSPAPTSGNLLD